MYKQKWICYMQQVNDGSHGCMSLRSPLKRETVLLLYLEVCHSYRCRGYPILRMLPVNNWMRVLELVNSCTSWASSNKQSFALELFRVLGKILLELHCNLRLFLPNPSSLIHRLLQVSDLYLESFPTPNSYSYSPKTRTGISLNKSPISNSFSASASWRIPTIIQRH